MNACSAPWYELNLSAPDDNASACCYYQGERETFAGGNVSLDHYWNGPNMRALRRLQADPAPAQPNGCSSCFYFSNKATQAADNYFNFDQAPPSDISDLQRANWELAKAEHAARSEFAKAVPLRLYSNFGYTCNLSCKMCHQVPRRQSIDKFITSDALYAWRDQMQRMMEVCVIGGEPFAMPEAIKFMRRFAEDDSLDPVRLSVFTNGTVHHKHFERLRQKRKMGFCISLDSIAGGYENIRVGGKWSLVERNVLMVKEAITKDRPEWWLFTNGIVMKTGIPYLPDFAAWHTKHGIQTQFLDFINFRGTEDAYFSENVIDQPHLLDEVPDWEDHFNRAIGIFEDAGDTSSAMSLRHFRDRAAEARLAKSDQIASAKVVAMKNDWWPADERDLATSTDNLSYHSTDVTKAPAFDPTGKPPSFSDTRPGESLSTPWTPVRFDDDSGASFRLVVEWDGVSDGARQTHVIAQWDHGELEGFRDYRAVGSSTRLTMTGIVPSTATQVRVIIFPVGEFRSYVPRRYSLDLDSRAHRRIEASIETQLAETPAEPIEAPVAETTAARASRSWLKRAPGAIRRLARPLASALRRSV